MQPLGVLVLTCGVWIIYSGVTGIPPLETVQKIIANPAQASQIITESKATAATVTVGSASAIVNKIQTGNPFAGMKINDTFQGHKDRGSQSPGVDFDAPVGTPIISPVSGTAQENPSGGAAGYMVTVTDANGYRHQFMHLSKFAGVNGPVKAGQVIGYSGGKAGAVGAGSSTGPHIHYNIITPSGSFMDPMQWLTRGKAAVQ